MIRTKKIKNFQRVFLLISFVALVETIDAQILNWEQRKLDLDDFRAHELSIDTLAGQSSVFIGMLQKSKGAFLSFSVDACFDQSESWIKSSHKNPETLMHEQGHFDITEIYARELSKKLNSKKFLIKETEEADLIYKSIVQEMNELQIQYDMETKGGTIMDKQQEWLHKIEESLKQNSFN